MISRHWRGIARTEAADRYVAHLRGDTFPQLAKLGGFVDAAILKRAVPAGVEFRIVTTWESLEAIRAFAGVNLEKAVVPEAVQQMMVAFDATVEHYEIVG
jgi:heme-degrading monooxygenase HmoA